METEIAAASLVVALVAVVIAVWQGRLSKRQLELARDTQGKTEAALQEIRGRTAETQRLTSEIKTNIDDRITRILDMRIEAEREELAKARRNEEQGAEMMGKLGGWFSKIAEQAELDKKLQLEAERQGQPQRSDEPPPPG